MIAIRFFFKKLTRGGVELERLAEQVGVSMFNSPETKFSRTGTNTIVWKADGPYEVEITDYH
jgi:hypothetical protein